MIINLDKKVNFIGLDGVANKAVRKFHLSPDELAAIRQKYAEQEILFNQNPSINDCYLMATLKSIMFGLNEYANKTNQQGLNARNWLKKLVVKDDKKNTEVFFPILAKLKARISVSERDINSIKGSQGNPKVTFLEYGYGILRKWTDVFTIKDKEITQVLDNGRPFLAIRDVAGLKSGQITSICFKKESKNEQEHIEDLFKKHTKKLFDKFQKEPESLVLTAATGSFVPDFLIRKHSYSIKKVVDNGLILVNPFNKANDEIFINKEDFYNYFTSVDFARLRPDKMFKMIEETKSATKNAPTLSLLVEPNFKPIRNTLCDDLNKGYAVVKDRNIV